jgi:phosphoribosylaminoimidazole-succinocarboxamide synthase
MAHLDKSGWNSPDPSLPDMMLPPRSEEIVTSKTPDRLDHRKKPPERPPLILGVDPGTRVVGYAVLEAGRPGRLLELGTIRLPPGDSIPLRLAEIYRRLREIIARYRPSVVAVERIFQGKNFQSAMKIGEARGVALLAGALSGIAVVEYTPAMVKKAATGNGGADKRQVQRMMARLLNLPDLPAPLDASDALAIAFCHARRLSTPTAPGSGPGGETPLQRFIQSLKRSTPRKRPGEGGASALQEFLRAAAGGRGRAAMLHARRQGAPARRSGMETHMARESRDPSGSGKGRGSVVMVRSELPGLELLGRGKVRDIYDLGEHLLLVASDRLSAFDVVLPDGIPDKGKVLTRLSTFWFGTLGFPNHLVESDVAKMPAAVRPFAEVLRDRVMLVRRLKIFPIECVARGYLSGSGWSEYKERGSVCGLKLPAGLVESDRLPRPIFAPTTKAKTGHDLPMTFEEVEAKVGKARAAELRDRTIAVYEKAAEYARKRGIIICDTKFEWGIPEGAPADDPKAAPAVLADEVLTPDSSRFWPADLYKPGGAQPSFDKQYVRDYLIALKWDKRPPGPKLPAEVIERTSAKYREIHERLTGRAWS